METNSKTLERRGLAKGLKVWIDILFGLSVLSAGLLMVMGPLSTLSDGVNFGVRIPVAIGGESVGPIHRLEVSPEALRQDLATDSARAAGASTPASIQPSVPPGFTLIKTRGELTFHPSNGLVKALYLSFALLLTGILVTGLYLIRGILTTAVEGRPFDPENPHRLNLLGWLVFVTGVVIPILQYRFSRWVLDGENLTGAPIWASFDFRQEWVFFGLVLLLLAAIWKDAVRMDQDQALTV